MEREDYSIPMLNTLFQSFFNRKKQSWYHIISASLIIVYWWGLWNILDFLFLGSDLSVHQIVSLISIITLSVAVLILIDFDLSDF